MKYSDHTTTIQELKDLVAKFSADRNWAKHHAPKNLAMNIAIEAAELMEHYVWEREGDPDPQEIQDELADILFNVLNFAETQNINLSEAFISKYKRLVKKYPAEIFSEQDDLELYRKTKQAYRKRQK